MLYSSLNERIMGVRENEKEINQLIDEYKPFIAACVEGITGRYVRYGEDDELSCALMAFMEAIKSYDITKGSFLSFARNVIKRRIIDFYRKEKRYSNLISIKGYVNDLDEEKEDLNIRESINVFSAGEISEYRRLELLELKKELSEWDISFQDLVETSPKHRKTRLNCSDIIKYIISNPGLIKSIKQKKYLPIADLEKVLKLPRKNIERARKYIIAALIILTGDYQYIKDYVDWGVKI